GQALEARRPLRFVVDGPVDRASLHREDERNHVRRAVRPDRCQASDAGGGQPRQRLLRRHAAMPSMASSARLRSRPPVYPPSPPPVRRTRWHGTTIGMGLAPRALPAARTARSLPAFVATSRYVRTDPNGIRAVA